MSGMKCVAWFRVVPGLTSLIVAVVVGGCGGGGGSAGSGGSSTSADHRGIGIADFDGDGA